MDLQGLKYVMLASEDVERSVGFYRDRLGLSLTMRFEDFAFFEAGGVSIVVTGESAGSGAAPQGTELVFGADSVTKAYDSLRERGVEFVNVPRAVNGDNWAVNLRDPDGHMLSVYGAQ